MKLIALLSLSAALTATDFGVDVLAFGASHHSNREYPWKEFNPGAAVAPFIAMHENIEAFMAVGAYKNSTDKGSFLQIAGIRSPWALSEHWQAGATAGVGVIAGYADSRPRPVAGFFVGWDWITAEATWIPMGEDHGDVPATSAACFWLRCRVVRF